MSYFGQKPEYSRKTIKERLYNLKFRFKTYDNLNFEDFNKWCLNISNKSNELNKKFFIDVDIYESSSGGCGCEPNIVVLVPFYEREETDEEYIKRISKEEKDYNEYLEIKKQEETQAYEYRKDMDEYERIKRKYHL